MYKEKEERRQKGKKLKRMKSREGVIKIGGQVDKNANLPALVDSKKAKVPGSLLY